MNLKAKFFLLEAFEESCLHAGAGTEETKQILCFQLKSFDPETRYWRYIYLKYRLINSYN